MLAPGINTYVRLAGESPGDKPLRTALVLDRRENLCTVEIENAENPPAPGDTICFFFDVESRFSQQKARVGRCLVRGSKCIMSVALLDQPVPADNRQSFRVSSATADLCARLNCAQNCPVIDVSFTGFAIVTDAFFEIGDSVTVAISFEGRIYNGEATIKSANPVDGALTRYGLHVPPHRVSTTLQKGLQAVSSSIQRVQLRRLSRGS